MPLQSSRESDGQNPISSVESPNDLDECWYLRIDNTQFGPVTRSKVETFLNPPRLCSLIHVMCTLQPGIWHSIAQHENLEKVVCQIVTDNVRGPQPVPTKSTHAATSPIQSVAGRIRELQEAAVSLIRRYRGEVGAIFAIVAVNTAILFVTTDKMGREREIVKKYEAVWKSVNQYSDKQESSDEWKPFTANAIEEIDLILNELRRSATARHPVRQNLLLCGRDHLIAILKRGEPPSRESTDFRLFERRLQLAKEGLRTTDDSSNQQLAHRIQ